jgi:hypothetical protein
VAQAVRLTARPPEAPPQAAGPVPAAKHPQPAEPALAARHPRLAEPRAVAPKVALAAVQPAAAAPAKTPAPTPTIAEPADTSARPRAPSATQECALPRTRAASSRTMVSRPVMSIAPASERPVLPENVRGLQRRPFGPRTWETSAKRTPTARAASRSQIVTTRSNSAIAMPSTAAAAPIPEPAYSAVGATCATGGPPPLILAWTSRFTLNMRMTVITIAPDTT